MNLLRIEREPDLAIGKDDENIKIAGHEGTWYVIDRWSSGKHGDIFLLESEQFGDELPCLIVTAQAEVLLTNVSNGYLDYLDRFVEP